MCNYHKECHQQAVTTISFSNLPLCKTHFLEYVERRVQETIDKYHLISTNPPDKLLLALSGGKDSQVLLYIIHKLYGSKIPIEGLYIQLGITHEGYSKDSETIARQFCEQLGVPFHSIAIKEKFGLDMDDLHEMITFFRQKKWSLGREHFKGECSYCGTYKRYSINQFAAEHCFTKVATGHNLTDEATALLINFFNVELSFLEKTGPINDNNIPSLIPRVKPLFYIHEEEIVLYAFYNQIPHLPTECVYSTISPNPKVKRELIDMTSRRPGLMMTIS